MDLSGNDDGLSAPRDSSRSAWINVPQRSNATINATIMENRSQIQRHENPALALRFIARIMCPLSLSGMRAPGILAILSEPVIE
jgi:hypothetical protein